MVYTKADVAISFTSLERTPDKGAGVTQRRKRTFRNPVEGRIAVFHGFCQELYRQRYVVFVYYFYFAFFLYLYYIYNIFCRFDLVQVWR